jgi:hypothetical protein
LSLSSGPIGGVVFQVFLLSWNRLLAGIKFRWGILIGLFVSFVLAIELLTKRSALDLIASFVIFDPASYWFRWLIFQFAWASAMNNQLFGVGLNQWERPSWMPASIDDFWLAIAVQHGLPAASLILLTVFLIFLPVSFKKGLDDKLIAYRTGFLITLAGFILAAFTVAFWDATYVLFFFLLGSGLWMLDVKAGK